MVVMRLVMHMSIVHTVSQGDDVGTERNRVKSTHGRTRKFEPGAGRYEPFDESAFILS